jgi:hypothetical protein
MTVHTLPVRPALRVVPQAPAGEYGYPEPAEHARVEIDHGRILIKGQRYATFTGETAAARVAAALMTLDAYGLLETVQLPQEVVRSMLQGSVAALVSTNASAQERQLQPHNSAGED